MCLDLDQSQSWIILFIFDLTNVIEKVYKRLFIFSYSGQASGGHYYSFIRNKDSDGEFRWYKFDDGDVTEIKMEDEEELKVSLLLPIIDGVAVLFRYFDILLCWLVITKRFLSFKCFYEFNKALVLFVKNESIQVD